MNRLRSHNREAYVIMVTASCDVETIQQALNQGAGLHHQTAAAVSHPAEPGRDPHPAPAHLRTRFLEQSDLDRLMGKVRPQGREVRDTPRIDAITLRQVLELLAGEPDSAFSTDTVALRSSLSRTTARRYLEYLESEDRVDVDLNYGQRTTRAPLPLAAGQLSRICHHGSSKSPLKALLCLNLQLNPKQGRCWSRFVRRPGNLWQYQVATGCFAKANSPCH